MEITAFGTGNVGLVTSGLTSSTEALIVDGRNLYVPADSPRHFGIDLNDSLVAI